MYPNSAGLIAGFFFKLWSTKRQNPVLKSGRSLFSTLPASVVILESSSVMSALLRASGESERCIRNPRPSLPHDLGQAPNWLNKHGLKLSKDLPAAKFLYRFSYLCSISILLIPTAKSNCESVFPFVVVILTRNNMRRGTKRSRNALAKGKQLAAADETFRHSVYVILLDPSVVRHPSILRLNPNREPTKPCVYVGMTGLPVEQRFENHKRGQKSAWVVRKYGLRLIPELYGFLNPMPFEAAAQMEKDLAEDLRADGYTVTGGT
jgi:hypothetical protein